ncbi:uncharacterized protein G2W53_045079 [Senna tora]|uniref:Uncharacterized protein n=1 Tax=Senna tora TaxID=362788 RepID=A0A834SE25_9FABA|nr:uncharacterized protein G2W53_045079 [Senna tora]
MVLLQNHSGWFYCRTTFWFCRFYCRTRMWFAETFWFCRMVLLLNHSLPEWFCRMVLLQNHSGDCSTAEPECGCSSLSTMNFRLFEGLDLYISGINGEYLCFTDVFCF